MTKPDTIIMYRTNSFSTDIAEREILKVNDKTVTFKSGQSTAWEHIETTGHKWHTTKQDAINHLKDKMLQKIEAHKRSIEYLENKLELLEKTETE